MDTWTVTDDDTGATGENGVVDFVIGSCLHADADYVYQYDFSPLGTGDVQVTLRWDNDTDLDLWVTDPLGELISYQNPTAASGGILDVDDVNGYGPENIFWPVNGAPAGDYTIQIDYFEGDAPTHYTIDILFFGNTYSYSGVIGINELVDIVEVSSSKTAIPINLTNRHKIEKRHTK